MKKGYKFIVRGGILMKKWIVFGLIFLFIVLTCVYLKLLSKTNLSKINYSSDINYDFSETAMNYLNIIGTRYEKRDSGTNGHDECAKWIVSELVNAGYNKNDIILQDFEIDLLKARNIILHIGGTDNTKKIIVGAHYDGTGVGDNGSGVALLLANICGIKDIKPDVNITCIFFDAEEEMYLGSKYYTYNMTEDEIKNTLFMINIDSIAFGDYCNIYGGITKDEKVELTDGYELAMNRCEELGYKVYRTTDLDGYYAKNGKGPRLEENAVYTNPWTKKNPSPNGYKGFISPAIGDWSDHKPFMDKDIPYIYFEATNWFAGDYSGYYETNNIKLGENGTYMNTKYDTLKNLNKDFPERALSHFKLYSPILSSLMIHSL